ncbi:unnamed protein product [Rotaria sordida]|uniref:Uncharacterized protein n=1 Tax=Rotaria sordida TaxID=392033 RepID=A0A816BVF3_9BILA|nr:unnamed protein product [Rotaria sordida]CAF1614559.1 unnamed protein product [Rotaria sordida]
MLEENSSGQPRLPLKDVLVELQEKIVNLNGNPNLNLYRIVSNNPIRLSSWIDFAYSIRRDCTTSRQL